MNDMGQATDLINKQNKMHKVAYAPIHSFIAQIIPYLEQRQYIVKSLYNDGRIRNAEAEKVLQDNVDYINRQILEILAIPSPNPDDLEGVL